MQNLLFLWVPNQNQNMSTFELLFISVVWVLTENALVDQETTQDGKYHYEVDHCTNGKVVQDGKYIY